MAHPHRTYQPGDTAHSVLHTVIRELSEPFLRGVSDRGDCSGLPRFVEQEFREFLTCGVLAHGFTRLRSADLDVLACPRCGGRLRVLATVQAPAPGRPSSPTLPAPKPPRRPAPPHPRPPHSRSPRLSSALDAAPDSRRHTPLPTH